MACAACAEITPHCACARASADSNCSIACTRAAASNKASHAGSPNKDPNNDDVALMHCISRRTGSIAPMYQGAN